MATACPCHERRISEFLSLPGSKWRLLVLAIKGIFLSLPRSKRRRTGSRHLLRGKDRNSPFTRWRGQEFAIYYMARKGSRHLLHGKDRNSPFTTWKGQKFVFNGKHEQSPFLRGKDRNSPFITWQGQKFAFYSVPRTGSRHLLQGKDRNSPFTTWQVQKSPNTTW